MKKLALATIMSLASVALLATPVLACPHSDKAEAAAPKTAEKAKEAPKAKEAAPAKDTAKTAKPAEKTTAKKPEKVSAR